MSKMGKLEDINISVTCYHDLAKEIEKKLDSIRNELKISFIGKISTPKNLIIKQIIDIDLPSFDAEKKSRYCSIIYNSTKLLKRNFDAEDYKDFQKYYDDKIENLQCFVISKNGEEIKNEKMMPIEDLESYINYDNKDCDKYEIYLPIISKELIEKISTLKNLFIKQINDIDFPSFDAETKNPYCSIVYHCTKLFKDKSTNFDDGEYKDFHKHCDNKIDNLQCFVISKNGKEIKNKKIMPIENVGSHLNDENNKNYDKLEICLPIISKELKLNDYIMYNTPPIGYSDELDKFVVEQCYEPCYLYVFVINVEESILEEEMKIISLLMEKRKVIEIKFVTAYNGNMSLSKYMRNEQYYANKTKEIIARFPGIIIISGHGYFKEPINDTSSSRIEKDAVPEEKRIQNLGVFIREKPTKEMIWTAVKCFKIKDLSITSAFDEINEITKCELQKFIENFEKIIHFISQFIELNNKVLEFNDTIRSTSWDSIYGSNYLIFGNPLINSLDILQTLIGPHISNESNLTRNISMIKCKFSPTVSEEFFMGNDNRSFKKYDICELNNLSELISKLGYSPNENISIKLYLNNEIHPIIKEEMMIIYYNDFDITTEEFDNYDGIAVILDYKSNNDNKNMNRKQSYAQTDNFRISKSGIYGDIQSKLQCKFGDTINLSNFDLIFYKILSNLKYHKIVNKIISSVQKFISYLNKQIDFDGNIKKISDRQFQQLDDEIISKIESTKCETYKNYINIANNEIFKFLNKTFMENLNISDEILFSNILDKDIFEQVEIKESEFNAFRKIGSSDKFWNFWGSKPSKANEILNYYGSIRTKRMDYIKKTYNSKIKEILSNTKKYKDMLHDIINNLQIGFCSSNIFILYQFSTNWYSTIKSNSLEKIYGSNYAKFGKLDILKTLIGQYLSDEENLLRNFTIIICNIISTNREYFVLHNDNKSINNEYDILKLKNLSELISKFKFSSNENISIELYLDNKIHPIIKEEMKIIYCNDFDINNEEFEEFAVILSYKSDNDNNKNRDIIKYFKSQKVQFYILISHDEIKSKDNFKEDIQKKLEIEIGDLIYAPNFNFTFDKILFNFKYHKIVDKILSLVEQFISCLDKQINSYGNIKEISDWQYEIINPTKNKKSEEIFIPENIEFINKKFLENMKISNEIFPVIRVEYICEDSKIKTSDFPIANGSLSAVNGTKVEEQIKDIYSFKTKKILSDLNGFKKMLNDKSKTKCKANIVHYKN